MNIEKISRIALVDVKNITIDSTIPIKERMAKFLEDIKIHTVLCAERCLFSNTNIKKLNVYCKYGSGKIKGH